MELIFGLTVLFIFRYFGNTTETVFLAGIFLVSFLIFVYDFKFLIIPNVLVWAGVIWILLARFIFNSPIPIGMWFTGFIIFLFFFLMHHFSQGRWVGGGDAKLGFVLGLWLGWPLGFLGLFAAYIIGAVVGAGLMLFKKITLKSQVPFGPFLIVGAWLAYIWGDRILEWYGVL